MKVTLEASLFESARGNALDLLALLQLGFEGRHLMTTDPLDDPRVSEWLAARAQDESLECRLALEAGVRVQLRTPSAFSVRIQTGAFPPRVERRELILSLSEALEFLRSPFQVLLEDKLHDREFILAIAKPEWRERLLEMERKKWLHFEHGGGLSRMPETVRKARQSPVTRLCLWVLFDSDSLAPGKPSEPVRKFMGICGADIAFHCLERRAVENYLPLMALEHWASYDSGSHEHTRTFRAFKSMTPSCRAHYNLKHGFHGDSRRDDHANVGTLYDDLPPQTRQALDHGFGPTIASLFARHTWSNWEWWMDAGQEREEGGRIIQSLFSRI
jgi:hypothetical protein